MKERVKNEIKRGKKNRGHVPAAKTGPAVSIRQKKGRKGRERGGKKKKERGPGPKKNAPS